jgi:hypothetical protein
MRGFSVRSIKRFALVLLWVIFVSVTALVVVSRMGNAATNIATNGGVATIASPTSYVSRSAPR